MSADPKILQSSSVNISASGEASPRSAPRATSRGNSALGTSADHRTEQIAHEEYVKLVQRVFLRATGDAPQVVVFSGIDPGNGCSRICRKAAEILAGASSGTVCLVDANLYSPPSRQDERNGLGLMESLVGNGPVRTYVHEMETQNLWMLPRGCAGSASANPIAIEMIRTRLQELRQEFDRVLIDAPPLNQHSDAVALAQLADGLIIVIEADVTRRETARKVMETLSQAGVKVLGAVLNKRMFPIPEKLYRQL